MKETTKLKRWSTILGCVGVGDRNHGTVDENHETNHGDWGTNSRNSRWLNGNEYTQNYSEVDFVECVIYQNNTLVRPETSQNVDSKVCAPTGGENINELKTMKVTVKLIQRILWQNKFGVVFFFYVKNWQTRKKKQASNTKIKRRQASSKARLQWPTPGFKIKVLAQYCKIFGMI